MKLWPIGSKVCHVVAWLCCDECLFQFLLPFCPAVCQFSSDLWRQQGISIKQTAAHWIFLFLIFGKFHRQPSVKIPIDRQFVESSNQPVQPSTSNQAKFKVKILSDASLWTSARRLHHVHMHVYLIADIGIYVQLNGWTRFCGDWWMYAIIIQQHWTNSYKL